MYWKKQNAFAARRSSMKYTVSSIRYKIFFVSLLYTLYLILNTAFANAANIASKSASLTTQATVEQFLTFSIFGINDNTAVNTANTGCPNTETTNAGVASSSTEVNLGILGTLTVPHIAAQLLEITTNAQNGYALSASSSGHLTNIAAHYSIEGSPTPVDFPLHGQAFGIHPCGIDVPEVWRTDGDLRCTTTQRFGNVCKYAWPASGERLILASDATGPIGTDVTPGNGLITLIYAASIDATVPGGVYTTTIRYIVTPTF